MARLLGGEAEDRERVLLSTRPGDASAQLVALDVEQCLGLQRLAPDEIHSIPSVVFETRSKAMDKAVVLLPAQGTEPVFALLVDPNGLFVQPELELMACTARNNRADETRNTAKNNPDRIR
jgi:hypothetical protein